MTRLTVIAMALCAVLLGGCVTSPPRDSAGGGASPERPMADASSSSSADAKAQVHVELGMAYASVGRYEIALDEARIALDERSGYAPAYHLMGVVYMFLGDQAKARENLERALRAAPGDPDFSNTYGWFLCEQGQEKEGLEYLASAARNLHYRYPGRPYTNAGMCLLRQNNPAAAETQFMSAVQADPANAQALYQLALIAYQRGDYAAAHERLIRMHRSTEPNAASVWLGVRTERQLGNRDAEASYAAQLRGRFSGSSEYQRMVQGQYE